MAGDSPNAVQGYFFSLFTNRARRTIASLMLSMRGRVGAAQEAFAAGAERGAGHHGHVLLVEQPQREVLGRQARARRCTGTRRTRRPAGAGQAHLLERLVDVVPPLAVLRAHLRHVDSGFVSASMAAFWLMVGAHSIVYWCIFIIASVSSGGAQA